MRDHSSRVAFACLLLDDLAHTIGAGSDGERARERNGRTTGRGPNASDMVNARTRYVLGSLVIALAMGERKLPGILAAVNRRLVNGLITDERTATALLASV